MKVFILINFLVLSLFSQNIKIDNQVLKIGLTNTWPPFNFSKDDTNIEGIAVDYWDIIKNKAEINSKIIKAESFTKVLENINSNKYNLTINAAYTKKRAEYAVFSNTYEFFPIAVVTKSDINFIPKTSLLNNKKVAVGREYSSYYLLKEKYPLIDYVLVENTKEALSLVKKGEAYAAIDILPVLQHYLFSEGNDLRINGITDVNFELKIMLNKNYENLLPKINQAISEITQEERNEIYTNRLLNPDKIDLTVIYRIGFFILILFLFFIYWNLKLKKAKDQINKEREKLKEILSRLPIPILIVDKETKKIVFANDYAVVLYKSSYEELLGNKIDVLYSSSSQREEILSAMASDGSLINFETNFKLFDGTLINGLLSYLPIVYEDKECRMGVVADVTELKTAQKELKLLNESLEEKVNISINKYKEHQMLLFQQAKLAQMGEMISMIAHQWRQPLSILFMIIQTLELNYAKDKLKDEQSFDNLIKDSSEQIKLMSSTINDFMNFFKPDKKIETFEVNYQIERSLSLLNNLMLNNNIELRFISSDKIDTLGYPNEFGQVIINLVANAKDAIIEKNIPNGSIEVSSRIENDNVIIELKDNAKGIDESILDKIFNPYFSTKLESKGTGLGLYMAKLIIEEHMHGKISVKNLKEGACFRIELKLDNQSQ